MNRTDLQNLAEERLAEERLADAEALLARQIQWRLLSRWICHRVRAEGLHRETHETGRVPG